MKCKHKKKLYFFAHYNALSNSLQYNLKLCSRTVVYKISSVQKNFVFILLLQYRNRGVCNKLGSVKSSLKQQNIDAKDLIYMFFLKFNDQNKLIYLKFLI